MDTFFSQLSSLSLLSITVRLLLTTVFAGTLGYERERHRQAAGFRTYIIVADAAALVMMTNLYIGDVFGSTDLVRMPASVITGLGFLGAGTILVTKSHEIKGLTTAAGLWVYYSCKEVLHRSIFRPRFSSSTRAARCATPSFCWR